MDPNTTAQQPPQIPNEPQQSGEKKSKLVPILLVGFVLIILVIIGEVIYLVLSDSDKDQTPTQTQNQTQTQIPQGDPESEASRQNLPTKEPYSLPEYNDERTGDVNALLDAVLRYKEDNNGSLPTGVTSTPQEISSTGVNICSALVPQYLSGLPIDPTTNNKVQEVTDCSVVYQTGYAISVSGENVIITVADEQSLDNIKAER